MNNRHMTGEGRLARRGFTLIEIMLSMGVLGVGMVMIATLFPAAIHQTRDSEHNTKAVLIAENARALIETHLTHGNLDSYLNGDIKFHEIRFDDTGTYDIHDDDSWYPSGSLSPDNDTYGWVALVRQITAHENDYQFVIIPYAKFTGVGYGSDNRPDLTNIASYVTGMDDVRVVQDSDGCKVVFEGSYTDLNLGIGSPVILDGARFSSRDVAGRFPTIVGLYEEGDDTVARLSGDLVSPDMETFDETNCGIWTMFGVSQGAPSPAIGCTVFRTKLKP